MVDCVAVLQHPWLLYAAGDKKMAYDKTLLWGALTNTDRGGIIKRFYWDIRLHGKKLAQYRPEKERGYAVEC